MAEDMNLEVAHQLTEHPEHKQAARVSRRWEEAIEILGVLVLAIAAVATAWGGYQAAKGDGRQSILYAEAGVDRVQATTVAIAGQQRLAADASTFNEWLAARSANDPQLQRLLVRRFSPEYRTAFAAWLKTAPFTTPSAPPGPAYMAEYHNPQLEQATHLNEEAAALEAEGTHARETAEHYIGATVLFALVLFLVAVSQRFRLWGVRVAAIAMAVVLLAYALYVVASLPRF
jgi:hypothetical protein